ncbi:MAG: MFS transporter, partial [Candidatus Dormibacteraeota bacterium]|nr:MFS transporter [Candidatus Dormibacteraeota bacterium]
VRGRVDLIINGSFWLGSILGSVAAIVLLNQALLPANVGWRVAFGLGAILGLSILVVRRHVPESPRWLFIHGREEEAETIVDSIEKRIVQQTGEELPQAEQSIKVRQREKTSFREIAQVAFSKYPRRAVLGLALFVGQAFLYNGVTFDLGTLYSTFYNVTSSFVPVFFIVFALGNLLGPLTLGRLFDTVGRKPMISVTYLGSAVMAVLMAVLFAGGTLKSPWALEALIFGTFFLASAGASAAYLTVSEIFPMETRALAIAFFYAAGTAVGGISGPLLFGKLIASGSKGAVAIAFLIGAVVMAIGGIAEIFAGVEAEGKPLEEVATPLSAEAAGGEGDDADTGDRELEGRIRGRIEQRNQRERTGARRYRPGPGAGVYVPAMLGSNVSSPPLHAERILDAEIDRIGRAVDEHGATDRDALASLVGARHWGPGRFSNALREATAEGRIRRLSRTTYGPGESR